MTGPDDRNEQRGQEPPEGPDGAETPDEAIGEEASIVEPEAVARARAEMGPPPELEGMPTRLLDAKAGLEEALRGRPVAREAAAQSLEDVQAAGNIQGVAIGSAEEGGLIGREPVAEPGTPTLTVYTVEPATEDQVRQIIVDELGIDAAAADEVRVSVITTGVIDALPHRFRLRPAPGGISVGHVNVTAGTLGCLAFGKTSPRNARYLILSNNHVLANSNSATYGDCVCQPGRADGGTCPNDQVAILERFVPMVFGGGTNYVDCATAWAWPDRVRKELLFLSGGVPNYFRISNTPVNPYIGMPVGKSGRTTQVTSGRVTQVGASHWVNYNGRYAWFQDSIAIQAYSGNFSLPGDSGSSIWTWNASRNPVGLLFAGGSGITFANRITSVMTALDIWLYT